MAGGYRPEEITIEPMAGTALLIARYPGTDPKKKPLVISAQSGQGLEDALRALTKYIDKARIVEPEDATPSEKAWQP